MPNRINRAMVQDYTRRFGEGLDFVAVDINGLSVAEFEDLRCAAREHSVGVFVVKTSLARLALRETLNGSGEQVDEFMKGPTALLYGGEEGIPEVARLVDDLARKTGKLAVRGGLFEKEVISPADVAQFKTIPDRQTLLGQVLGTIIAPLTHTLGAVQALLASPAALADALARKREEEGGGEA